jgi:alkaline phosphatase D
MPIEIRLKAQTGLGSPDHPQRENLTMLRLSRLLALNLLLVVATESLAIAADLPLTRIIFGSCAKQDQPQPIWDAINELKPELFIFLGDNIYGDSTYMAVMLEKYTLLRNQPGFVKLKQSCPVIGTWDDHDYGADDAGVEYSKKRESQQLFLDFFDVPRNDPRRAQEGVYSSHISGPVGKRVQIILLDTRYFRSPLKRGFQAGEPGEGVRGLQYFDTNFGAILIDWNQPDPVVRLQVRDAKGDVVLQHRLRFSQPQ